MEMARGGTGNTKAPGCSGNSEHGQGANRETSRVLATFQEVADLAWVLKEAHSFLTCQKCIENQTLAEALMGKTKGKLSPSAALGQGEGNKASSAQSLLFPTAMWAWPPTQAGFP